MAEHPAPSELEGGRRLLTRKQALAGGGAAVAALGAPALAQAAGAKYPTVKVLELAKLKVNRPCRSTIPSRGSRTCCSTWGRPCPSGVGPKRQHRRLQRPLPAHGLPGGVPAQDAGVLLPVPPDAATTRSGAARSSRAWRCDRCRASQLEVRRRRRLRRRRGRADLRLPGTTSIPARASEVAVMSDPRATTKAAQPQARRSAGRSPARARLVAAAFLGRRGVAAEATADARRAMALLPRPGRAPGAAGERQGPHVGLPVLQRRLRLQDLHLAGRSDAEERKARAAPLPKPRSVTGSRRPSSPARVVDGKDCYIAVVPDKDCVVNRGDHSPRGGTNALTVYTTRKHPLTKPTERLLYPQVRDDKGGALERRDLGRGARPRRRRDQGGARQGRAVVDRPVGRRPPVARDELHLDEAVLRRAARRASTTRALGPDKGVAVRAIHNRAEVELRAPLIADHFGSALDAPLLVPRLRGRRHGPALGRQLATRPARSSTTACSPSRTRRS